MEHMRESAAAYFAHWLARQQPINYVDEEQREQVEALALAAFEQGLELCRKAHELTRKE